MSAETLRRAADDLRLSIELAASQPQTGATVTGVWLNARYHPVIPTPAALALADWLDRAALTAPPDPHHEGGRCETCENVTAALNVATAYLGGAA